MSPRSKIIFPNHPWNNVWYKYGVSGTEAGRIVYQQDATGVQQFHYDFMGNVDTNWHTYVQPHLSRTLSLKTAWRYDSWGRVQNITYPDREKVDYRYDFGGQLYSIDGYKNGHVGHTPYIREILYDHFGQRTQVIDGDGVKTTYTYDAASRRLIHLRDSSYVTGELLQDNTYRYDPVGNIISIQDSGRNHRVQTYKYDDANRLIGSDGNIMQEHSTAQPYGYTANYTYSPAGRFLNKYVKSDRLSTSQGPHHVAYDNTYFYNHPDNPYAITHIQDAYGAHYNFHWDANGNMVRAYMDNPYAERRFCWTEDNKLQGYTENSEETGEISAWYNYDDGGERNFKITSPKLHLRQNAVGLSYAAIMKYPTLYASALITFNRGGYTKHYFEGSNRICSKIGGGFSDVDWGRTIERLPEMQDNYEHLSKKQSESVYRTFKECLGIGVVLDGVADLYDVIKKEHERREKEPTFYYHSDHLGSAAYLTNDVGQITQTLNYLPYGEDWVDRQEYHETRYPCLGIYTFNGKEKDYESGFHNYGARYYWSEVLTGWLSVDPLSDKYPSISPYAYCAWNPVKLVDPDGREIWINGSDGNSYKYRKGKLYTADGKLYTGNDAFAQKACSDITALKKSGLKMHWKISRMERSKKMITINESTSDNNQCSLDDEGQYNRKVGSGSTINYNPNKTSNADGKRDPRYGLAHELGHAYDAMRGKMDDSPCIVYKPIGDDLYVPGTIPYSEIRAVKFENIARPSNQQRTTYDGFELNFYLQKKGGSNDKYYGFE